MDRAEALKTVRAIFVAKAEAETSRGRPMLMDFYLAMSMYKKYGKPALVAETLYSLIYTCAQHAYEPELRLFLLVRYDMPG